MAFKNQIFQHDYLDDLCKSVASNETLNMGIFSIIEKFSWLIFS